MKKHFNSGFAVLDITDGRNELLEYLNKHGDCDVVIKGKITGAWGNDDGISREFEVQVNGVDIKISPELNLRLVEGGKREND